MVPPSPSSPSAEDPALSSPLGTVVTNPWGWRILALFVLVALGLCITFSLDGHPVYGALWAVVTVGWAFFDFKLWRRHTEFLDRP